MTDLKFKVTEEYDLDYRDKSKIMKPFKFWDYHTSDAKNILKEFFSKTQSPSVSFFIEILQEELKLVFSVKNEHK